MKICREQAVNNNKQRWNSRRMYSNKLWVNRALESKIHKLAFLSFSASLDAYKFNFFLLLTCEACVSFRSSRFFCTPMSYSKFYSFFNTFILCGNTHKFTKSLKTEQLFTFESSFFLLYQDSWFESKFPERIGMNWLKLKTSKCY